MRNRSIRVRTSMSQDEFAILKAHISASGLGIEEYVRRQLVQNEPVIYKDNMERQTLLRKVAKEVNSIGTNINQIAHIANISRSVHPERIDELLKELDRVLRAVNALEEE